MTSQPPPRRGTGATEPAYAAHLPAGVDAAALDLLAEGSLPRAATRRWGADPGAPALHCPDHGWRSAAELEDGTARLAAGLAATGLCSGDRVVLCAASSCAFVDAVLALLRLGAVVVLLNPACSEREALHVAADSDPAAAIVDDPQRGEWIARGAHALRSVFDITALPRGNDRAPRLDEAVAADPALIMYTSGTTGTPKGALLSHGNLLASAAATTLAWRWTARDRLVLALPLFHAHGLGVGLAGTLLTGSSVVLLQRFEATAVLDAAAAHGATMFFGVPTMYARLAAEPRSAELSRLRLCVSGSAPLPPSVFARIEELSGQRVLERYGMTETLMTVSNPHDGERRPGTVGLPLPGVEVRLAEPDRGEILVRGPSVFGGYWGNEAATRDSFDADGFLRTGDVGEHDSAGYLRIVGRTRELIITGGFNVYPREVEEVLAAHPGVAECAVVGTPSEEWGEVVTAFVVRADARLDAGALAGHARELLAPYKVPRAVHFVDALPRNAMGKVVKQALAAPGDTAR